MIRILVGDALARLKELPAESVHCCVTSPPYWNLRSYEGGEGMIGLESTFNEHLDNLVAVFREVRRVLRRDGVCFLNYGDAYWPGGPNSFGWKAKDRMDMPGLVSGALMRDGWYRRDAIVWCLSGGTWLYARTQKGVGIHMLKDLVRLDPSTVSLWNGQRWAKVLGWSETPRPANPVELVLRSGERIGCTGDHRWPTQRGLVAAAELAVGDMLRGCRLPGGSPAPRWLTNDALWFAGLYLAEGSMSGDTIQISGHVRETERWLRIQRLSQHYGAMARRYEDGDKQAIHIDRSGALRSVLVSTIAGKGAKGKRLAGGVWAWDNASLRILIQGYLDGDGSQDGPRWRLGFARNYGLERDLRCAASRLGATLTLNTTFATCNGRQFPAFRGEWRWNRSGHWNEKDRGEIMEIRRSRARRFYDVGVADEPHLFALASGVLTHNSKPNPMPESVRDRPTSAYEMVYLLSRSPRYFYDADAVRLPSSGWHGKDMPTHAPEDAERQSRKVRMAANPDYEGVRPGSHRRPPKGGSKEWEATGRTTANLRNVLTIPTHGFREAHFATFPPKLIEPFIKAGTSEYGCCAECGKPWERVVEVEYRKSPVHGDGSIIGGRSGGEHGMQGMPRVARSAWTTGFKPSCGCDTDESLNCTVLDPFAGAGTTGLVAERLARHAILIEISREYARMAQRRIQDDNPLFSRVAVSGL